MKPALFMLLADGGLAHHSRIQPWMVGATLVVFAIVALLTWGSLRLYPALGNDDNNNR